jgi:hypothetical protein
MELIAAQQSRSDLIVRWVRIALALRSSCDGHHKKALFIAEPRKKNRAFLTAPALAGISSNLMQSHWTKARRLQAPTDRPLR